MYCIVSKRGIQIIINRKDVLTAGQTCIIVLGVLEMPSSVIMPALGFRKFINEPSAELCKAKTNDWIGISSYYRININSSEKGKN